MKTDRERVDELTATLFASFLRDRFKMGLGTSADADLMRRARANAWKIVRAPDLQNLPDDRQVEMEETRTHPQGDDTWRLERAPMVGLILRSPDLRWYRPDEKLAPHQITARDFVAFYGTELGGPADVAAFTALPKAVVFPCPRCGKNLANERGPFTCGTCGARLVMRNGDLREIPADLAGEPRAGAVTCPTCASGVAHTGPCPVCAACPKCGKHGVDYVWGEKSTATCQSCKATWNPAANPTAAPNTEPRCPFCGLLFGGKGTGIFRCPKCTTDLLSDSAGRIFPRYSTGGISAPPDSGAMNRTRLHPDGDDSAWKLVRLDWNPGLVLEGPDGKRYMAKEALPPCGVLVREFIAFFAGTMKMPREMVAEFLGDPKGESKKSWCPCCKYPIKGGWKGRFLCPHCCARLVQDENGVSLYQEKPEPSSSASTAGGFTCAVCPRLKEVIEELWGLIASEATLPKHSAAFGFIRNAETYYKYRSDEHEPGTDRHKLNWKKVLP